MSKQLACTHHSIYRSDVQQDKDAGPATVDDEASAQPHVYDEHHEVAVVVVTNAVEHPGCTFLCQGTHTNQTPTMST